MYNPCLKKNTNFSSHASCGLHLFLINNPILTLAPKIVSAFLKNRLQKLFSNYLVDGPLTSIV